jgi:hypothetical protein
MALPAPAGWQEIELVASESVAVSVINALGSAKDPEFLRPASANILELPDQDWKKEEGNTSKT